MKNEDISDPPDFQEKPVITDLEGARCWMRQRRIEEVECIVSDQSGVARGKLMPSSKFLNGRNMNLPQSIFLQTITGDYPEFDDLQEVDVADSDYCFVPDFSTLSLVPWEDEPTAQIIHDAFDHEGNPVDIAPRQVLRRVIDLYRRRGWKPVVAPEIEFYLVKPNTDPDYPLEPPIGRSGRPESGRKSYSISAVNEFDPLFEDIYDYSEAQGLEIDTLIHEEGAAQMEINLRHGDPLALADQVFLFKRTIREAGLAHNIHATFMAKPIAAEPGSAMHIHHSVVDAETGLNIFSDEHGGPAPAFYNFIGGLRGNVAAAMCLFAPYVNSYRRLTREGSAPINNAWGLDNRTTGMRVPVSGAADRRVENRIPSSDANPYLAIAASLACGYIGLVEQLDPGEPVIGSAQHMPYGLPRGLLEGVAALQQSDALRGILGDAFVNVYCAIKLEEYETFMRVISPWEREYLLLNV